MIKSFEINELALMVQGKILQMDNSVQIDQVVVDSRKIMYGSNSVFIDIKGFKYDGHAFLSAAYKAGVRNFVVEEGSMPKQEFSQANILAVPDTLAALQKIARWNRSRFQAPVVGITGSNGKTIVKEWLGQVIGRN